MGNVIFSAHLKGNPVGSPVLDAASVKKTVVRQCPGPDNLCPCIVILRFLKRLYPIGNDASQGPLTTPVSQIHMGGVGKIPLHDMGHHIHNTASNLIGRQTECQFRINDGKHRPD